MELFSCGSWFSRIHNSSLEVDLPDSWPFSPGILKVVFCSKKKINNKMCLRCFFYCVTCKFSFFGN